MLDVAIPRDIDQYDTEVSSSGSLNEPSRNKKSLEDAELGHKATDDASTASRRRRCTCASLCCLFLLVVVSVISVYFVVILDGDVNNIPVPEAWNNIFDEDPFDSVDPEDAPRWRNGGQGATLRVINALDDRWHPYFDKSVSDWDNGYPDAVELVVDQVRQPDPECLPEQGFIKTCNGNYGQTPWKGRAEILSDALSNTIVAASARLNEFYLSDRNTDEMQYAMCHELGHAWGVHHTDESFTNRDLGNCMDYTNRHHNNLTPDFSNYVFLHALYGLVPGSTPYNPPTAAPTSSPTTPTFMSGSSNSGNLPNNQGSGNPSSGGSANPPPQSGKDDKKDKEDKKDKDDRTRFLDSFSPSIEDASLSEELVEAILESRRNEDPSNEGSFDVNLPGGYILHVHQLRA